MLRVVGKMCARKFNREVPVENFTTKVKFGWELSNEAASISILQNDSELKITRARFKFTAAECNDTKGESLIAVGIFANARASVNVLAELVGVPRCMHTLQVWGKYQ
jgi:hypothetical protein